MIAAKDKNWMNKWLSLEFHIFQYFMYILAKLNFASRSWKPILQYIFSKKYISAKLNTSRSWKPILQFRTLSILSIPRGSPEPMGIRRNYSRGGKVDILLIFFWLLTMQRKLTYTKKENVQCYGNSCIQYFPCKNTLHWANVCFSEHGYFKTE